MVFSILIYVALKVVSDWERTYFLNGLVVDRTQILLLGTSDVISRSRYSIHGFALSSSDVELQHALVEVGLVLRDQVVGEHKFVG